MIIFTLFSAASKAADHNESSPWMNGKINTTWCSGVGNRGKPFRLPYFPVIPYDLLVRASRIGMELWDSALWIQCANAHPRISNAVFRAAQEGRGADQVATGQCIRPLPAFACGQGEGILWPVRILLCSYDEASQPGLQVLRRLYSHELRASLVFLCKHLAVRCAVFLSDSRTDFP